jgi:hypothetical protein
MCADLRMEQSTGKAVKLRHVPQNSRKAVKSGSFQSLPLFSLLISVHHSENTAPSAKGKIIEAAVVFYPQLK